MVRIFNSTITLWIVFILIYGGAAIITLIIARRRRKKRWPFKDTDRLLRGPGETLRRQIVKMDERAIYEILGAFVAASIAYITAVYGTRPFYQIAAMTYVPPLIGFLTAGLFGVRLAILLLKRSNLLLGWFGERLVAEKLRSLQAHGFHVFHDVPAERGKHGFNIDHVVIGPSGVAIVEVKTRRKGNSRPGYKDHEVSFDGVRLDWPWGYDQRCIQQALNEADWLAKWIMARTGLKLPVQAVLTIPGWWVNERATRPLRVVNPSFLPDVIRQLADTPLSPQKVELIVRQLDVVCRDVEE